MSVIGVIFSSLNDEANLALALSPWIEARRTGLGGHKWLICAVSVPFHGFDVGPMDMTQPRLEAHLLAGDIDHLIAGTSPMLETESRGAALVWLREQGADITWQADGDEHPTVPQIERIAAFVERNPLVVWFRLCLRNAVFNERTFLVEPFTPPRIHRVHPKVGVLSFTASCFLQDNDVGYAGGLTRDIKVQGQFASMTVPKSVAWVKHLSWIGDRARRKVAYQQARGWQCSFAWDDAQGGLIWNGAPQETETE